MQVKRTGEVGKIFERYFQPLDVENGGQYGNYCFKNFFQFLVCLDEWMGLLFLEDTIWGKIIGLILGMLNYRTSEAPKRRCCESRWCRYGAQRRPLWEGM